MGRICRRPVCYVQDMLRIALILLAAANLWADDGKAIATRDGKCEVTVPASWPAGSFPGAAESADRKVNVTMSAPRVSDFQTLKTNATKLYSNDKVTKDSASEFQMEGASMNNKPNVYRAINSGGKLCLVEVIYQSGAIDDARKIANTLKAK